MVLSQQNLDDVKRFLNLQSMIDALQREIATDEQTEGSYRSARKMLLTHLQSEQHSLVSANVHFWVCALFSAWKDQQRFMAAFREVNELARTLEAHDPQPILNRIAEVQP